MRNIDLHLDEHFLEIHPDLASLYHEVISKKIALKELNARSTSLKDEINERERELKSESPCWKTGRGWAN